MGFLRVFCIGDTMKKSIIILLSLSILVGQEFYQGDITLDEIVNVQDLVYGIAFILGNINEIEDQAYENFDVNNDGGIDIIDVITLINLIQIDYTYDCNIQNAVNFNENADFDNFTCILFDPPTISPIELSNNNIYVNWQEPVNTPYNNVADPQIVVSAVTSWNTPYSDFFEVEIFISSTVDIYGFQLFNLPYSSAISNLEIGYGGLAPDAGFNIQVNEEGMLLGFSLTGMDFPNFAGQ